MFGYILLKNADYKHLCDNTDELYRLQSEIRKTTRLIIESEKRSEEHYAEMMKLNNKLDAREITYEDYQRQWKENNIKYNSSKEYTKSK